MSLKELILQKGWAGKNLTRRETIERLNPIVRAHYRLLHGYDYAIRTLDDKQVVDRLEGFQKTTRADIGKLAETILSAGGVPYNGVDLEPSSFNLGDDAASIVRALRDQETAFEQLLAGERRLDHQMRTRAILQVLHQNSQERLEYTRGLVKQIH